MGKRRWVRRRRLAWVTILFIALVVSFYAYQTRPARLRAKALEAMASLPGGRFDVAHVTCTVGGRLRLSDVTFEAHSDKEPDGEGLGPRLHIANLDVRCGLTALVAGRVEPKSIHADRVLVTLVRDVGGREDVALADSLDVDAQRIHDALAAWCGRVPRIDVKRLDLNLMTATAGRVELDERRPLTLQGESGDESYELRIERLGAAGRALATVQWDYVGGDVALMVDWARLDTLKRALPRRVVNAMEQAELEGRVRLDRLVLRGLLPGEKSAQLPADPTLIAAELQMEGLAGVIPAEESMPGGQNPTRYLRIKEGTAALVYSGEGGGKKAGFRLFGKALLAGAKTTFEMRARRGLLKRLGVSTPGDVGKTSPGGTWLDDVERAAVLVEELDLPTEETHAAFVNSPKLSGPLRAALRDYRPVGKVNLRFNLLAGSPGTPLGARMVGEVESLGASCVYRRFRYGFEDTRGRLLFRDGGFVINGIEARHGSADIVATGTIFSTKSWSGFDLEFRARNVPLNRDLYEALPPEYRTLWEAASPIGLCDIVAHVSRPDGSEATGPGQPDVRVAAQMLSGSISLDENQRLDHVDGRLWVEGGVVHLLDLHGYDGTTSLRQVGRVWEHDGRPAADLMVTIADLDVDTSSTLAVEHAADATGVRFVGKADAWGRVYTGEEDGERRDHFAVCVKDGRLHSLDPGRQWTDGEGWLLVRGGEQEILSFACQQGDARFEASGLVPGGTSESPLTLDLRAEGGALEELLPQFVPEAWARFADEIGLSGAGDVQVTLRPSVEGDGKRQQADIQVRSKQMRASPMPLDLQDMRAHVVVTPDGFDVRSLDATWGESGRIRASGGGSWEGEELNAAFEVAAENMRFCPELNEALPVPLARLIERLSMEGDFDALLGRVELHGGEKRSWHVEGDVPLRAAAMHLGLPLTELDGEVTGACVVDPVGEVRLDSTFTIRRALLAERLVTDWEGRLVREPGERWVRVEGLHGALCGGDALGALRIDPETSEYEISLTLRDVALAGLFPRKDGDGAPRPGRLDATLKLRGNGGNLGSRRGSGDLRVRGVSFRGTPVLEEVRTAGMPEGGAASDSVDRADVRFLWEGSVVRLTRVEITSKDLRLVGEGSWNLRDDTIQMTLVGAHPRDWPRVLLLTDIVEGAGRRLVQYHIRGKLDSPTVKVEPLYQLNQALKALLRGGD